jgi:dolichol-phosphate mannosyltransferase
MNPRISVIVPAYNEGASITKALDTILEAVAAPCEVLVVYDTPVDTTAPYAAGYAEKDPRVVPTLNTSGRGPARAISFGMARASAEVVVVTMADGSDDPHQIDELAALVMGGAAVASASRYSRGGAKVGGPRFKGLLSRVAGVSLARLARVGTRDATNSFKAYSTDFVRSVRIESTAGFELGLELVAKAHRLRLEIREIPTVWRDRTEGESNFKLTKWLPKYLRWYLFAFGKRLTPADLAAKARVSS